MRQDALGKPMRQGLEHSQKGASMTADELISSYNPKKPWYWATPLKKDTRWGQQRRPIMVYRSPIYPMLRVNAAGSVESNPMEDWSDFIPCVEPCGECGGSGLDENTWGSGLDENTWSEKETFDCPACDGTGERKSP
jgi:hypothetical protein